MGNQFRSDNAKATVTASDDTTNHKDAKRERQDEGFEASHADRKLAKSVNEPAMNVVHAVEGLGTEGDLAKRFSDAMAKRDDKAVVAAVRDMGSKQRFAIPNAEIMTFAEFATPREVMIVSDLAETNLWDSLRAVLVAKPRISTHELRGYLADGAYSKIAINAETVGLLRGFVDAAKGNPLDLFSEIDDLLPSKPLMDWYLEVTPPKDVARDMLDTPDFSIIRERSHYLNAYGPAAWNWLDAIDATIAQRADPVALSVYKDAFGKGPVPAALATAVAESDHHQAESQTKRHAEASAIVTQRATIVKTKSGLEIVEAARGAGLVFDDQINWLLDKPGLSAAEFHRVTASILPRVDDDNLSDATVFKLMAKFPTTSVTELFGDVPDGLASAGALNDRIARWLVAGAAPETILQIVAASPGIVESWCGKLDRLGVGYGWLHQLGGRANDNLLRRFALGCTNAGAVSFIEDRLLGSGSISTSDVKTGEAMAPAAHGSAASRLAVDVKQAEDRRQEAGERAGADVVEMTPAEIERLGRDPAMIERLMATANATTFARILDLAHVDLAVAVRHADASKIGAAQLLTWSQTRPAVEVAAFLKDDALVAKYVAMVTYGLLDCFPSAAPILAQVLGRAPIVRWLLASAPAVVLEALESSVANLDAAARAFASMPSEIAAWLPPAGALDHRGRGAIIQLSARAHGALRDVLREKLEAGMPDEDAPGAARAADAANLKDPEADPLTTAIEISTRSNDPSTLRAFLRTHPIDWRTLAEQSVLTLAAALPAMAPDVATGKPLADFLANKFAWPWAMATVAPHRILDALGPSSFPVAAELVDNAARVFFESLPRGALLTAAQKASLHEIARMPQVSVYMRAKLFEIAFDVPLSAPSADAGERLQFDADELEKIWSAVEKVPHAHVDERSIRNFVSVKAKQQNQTLGTYDPENRSISIDTVSEATTERLYANQTAMTEEQAIAAAGSKADFERLLATNRMQKNEDKYVFVITEVDQFSTTILHEVGHSVDAMLGNKTELVYSLAGWQRFGLDRFEHFVEALGGWGNVKKDEDRRQIAHDWRLWIAGGAKGPISQLVAGDHAVLNSDYSGVGVVAAATARNLYDGHVMDNGAHVGFRNGELFLLSARGHDGAPTPYSLTAPEEYFAECYAMYYSRFVTSKGKEPKGALVAPWIKTWIDQNVDTIGHNPLADRFPREKS